MPTVAVPAVFVDVIHLEHLHGRTAAAVAMTAAAATAAAAGSGRREDILCAAVEACQQHPDGRRVPNDL